MIGPPETDIPIPEGRPLGFLGKMVRELKPGESRKIDPEHTDAARVAAHRAGISVTIRKCEDGWRIWRLVA